MSKIRPQTPWVGVVRWGGPSLDTGAAAMKWASDAVETWQGLGRGSGRAALRRWRMAGGSRVPGPGRTTFPQTPGSEPRDAGAAPPWRAETPLRALSQVVRSPGVCYQSLCLSGVSSSIMGRPCGTMEQGRGTRAHLLPITKFLGDLGQVYF